MNLKESGSGKILILVRHAHRDQFKGEENNGLSEKGHKQTRALSQILSQTYDLENALFLSSPKVRCIQTLEPLAQLASTVVKTDPRLIERQENEEETKFKKRIERFLKSWLKEADQQITILCSHGDWLPHAVHLLTSAHCEFQKASWVEIVITHPKPILQFRSPHLTELN